MKMIDHNHFICHLILGTFTEYPFLFRLSVLGRLVLQVFQQYLTVVVDVFLTCMLQDFP